MQIEDLLVNRLYYIHNDENRYIYRHEGIGEDNLPYGRYYKFGDTGDNSVWQFEGFHRYPLYQFELLPENATFSDYIKNKPF